MFALAGLALAGCGGGGAEGLEPVTLRLGIPYQASDLLSSLSDEIERYREEQSNVTVDVVNMYYGAETEEAPLDAYLGLAYGNPRSGGPGQPGAISLEPFIAEDPAALDAEGMFPLLLDTFRRDGELYGIPAGASVALLYYNRDIFDAQGVAYPRPGWTWQDLLDAAVQLTTAEVSETQGHWGLVADPVTSYLFVLQNGGALFDDPVNPTRVTFDDPRVTDAIRWFTDLALVYDVMPTQADLRRVPLDDGLAFSIGRAAMWIGLSGSDGGGFEGIPWSFQWGAAPLPGRELTASWVFTLGYFVSADTAHAPEAWGLVTSLSQAGLVWVPPQREAAESEAFRQRVGDEMADAILAALDSDVLVPMPSAYLAPGIGGGRTGEVWSVYSSGVRDVIEGYITVDTMMEQLEQSVAW